MTPQDWGDALAWAGVSVSITAVIGFIVALAAYASRRDV